MTRRNDKYFVNQQTELEVYIYQNSVTIKYTVLISAQNPSCVQVRKARGHTVLRRQKETLRGCKYKATHWFL